MLSRHRKEWLFFVALVGTLFVAMGMQSPPGPPAPAKSAVKVVAIPLSSAARAARSAAKEKRHDAEYQALIAMYREPVSLLKNITQSASVARVTRGIGDRYVNRSQIMQRDDKNAHRVAPDTSTLLADIAVLRLQQRAELRSVMTREQRPQFDKNVATVIARQRRGAN